jgi:ABC-type uncharacterized transport system auxiliary subunit
MFLLGGGGRGGYFLTVVTTTIYDTLQKKEECQMSKRILIPAIFCFALALLFSSHARAAFNLANDPRFYQYSNHAAKKNFRSSLQIKVMEDKRPQEERVQRDEPPFFVYDGLWSDFVDKILLQVMAREFTNANIFNGVDLNDENSHYLLIVDLYSFAGKIETAPGLRPVYNVSGTVDFQIKLVSRKKGTVLYTKRYKERAMSVVSQFKASWNKYAYAVIELGKALQVVTVKVMKDVETAMAGGRVSQY